MTIKDSIETAGVICTGGTKGRATFKPTHDATVVARLRGAGAILLGKTNLPELSLSYETDNLVYGRTNNPYDLSRTPGGSSGGGAAIIAGVDWCDPSIVPMPWSDPRRVDLKGLRVAFHTDNGIISPTSDTVAVFARVVKALSDTALTVGAARPHGIEETNEIRAGVMGIDGGAGVHKLLQIVGTKG